MRRVEPVALALQQRLDHAVHQQVGIAPDRAREVRVGLVGQAEVAAVPGRVDGLLHRAQQHRVDLLRVDPVLRGLRQRLVFGRLRVVADRQAQPQRLQVVLQRGLLLRRRTLVHAEQHRVLVQRDEVGGADVGRQHRLLDQPVGVVAGARDDALDAAVVVADDLRLGGLEIDRAAPLARLQQRTVDVVQVQQVRHQLGPLRRLGAARVAQHRGHLVVGEPRVRIDHGGVELVGALLAIRADQHVAHHRQAVLLRIERAQAVGELFRQHRDDPAREIDRRRALVGVGVERLARLHVVTHVGDRHDQSPAADGVLAAAGLVGLAIDGVVEVARVLAVDGDERHVGEVDAALHVDGAHVVGQLGRLGQRLRREPVRHLVFADRDLDLHARIVDLAQHLGDAAHRLRVHRRRLGELDRHHLARDRGRGGVLRDEDVLSVAAVLRGDQPRATFVEQAPDDRRLAAFDDLEDAPFGTALAVEAHEAHLHAVAVQHGAHLLLRDVDVGLAVVALDEPVSVAVTEHHALGFTHLCATQRGGACNCFVLDDMISFFADY